MTEIDDLFDYGLKIYQNTDYFKFSIDSILLGEFICLKQNMKILDICTGNAPVPLILTTKNRQIDITALEIQKEVYNLAYKSAKLNNLTDTIHIENVDARLKVFDTKFDVVCANPPYFKVTSTSQKNENKIKSKARHELTMTLKDVIEITKNNLKENGTLYMVHRVERYLETLELLKHYKFGVRKTVFINTKSNKPSEFFLIEASKSKKSDLKVYTVNIENLKTYKNIFEELDK